MALKDWLGQTKGGKAGKKASGDLSSGDLINLGRYEDALAQLQERVRRRPKDHHSRLRLADLLMKIGRRPESVEEYLRVSDGFEKDGFYDKAYALVAKVSRFVPEDERLMAKSRRLTRMKRLDHLRQVVVDSLSRAEGLKVGRLWNEMVKGEILGRLTEDQLRRVLPNMQLREFAPDEEYVSAGVRRDELAWIIDGEICARVILPNGSITDIRCFDTGDLVGERALFEQQPWPAVYVSSTKTVVLVLDREGLAESLKGEADPRSLIEAFRAERHDQQVAAAVSKMAVLKKES